MPKKTKTANDNKAYNPRGKKRPLTTEASAQAATSGSAVLAITRSINAKETPGGSKVKTSVLAEKASISTPVRHSIVQQLAENLPPTHVNAAKILETSESGSPLKIQTPEGSELDRVRNIGKLHFFTNIQNAPVADSQTTIDQNHPFFSSPEYQAIKKILQPIKFQEVDVTPDLLDESSKARVKRQKSRVVSQHQVVVEEGVNAKLGSATKYADATQLFSGEVKREWLHLVAHMVLDIYSQHINNLVVGTAATNTEMLFVEEKIRKLANEYPERVNIKVLAQLIPGTHIASTISYVIETKDFTLDFKFDAQNPSQPHIAFEKYIHAYIDGHITGSKKADANDMVSSAAAAASSTTLLSPKSTERRLTREQVGKHLFFDRPTPATRPTQSTAQKRPADPDAVPPAKKR